jgi:hypothetical protein
MEHRHTGEDQKPVTTADVEYGASLIMGKENPAYENIRYYTTWQFFAGYVDGDGDEPFAIEIIDAQTYRIYEERRYVFAFESHDLNLFAPKHIWEPWVNGPDATPGTGDDNDPSVWTGWQDVYMSDPVRARLGLSAMDLTYLIGFGPFVYHHGGWDPGVSTHIEYNPLYFAGKINEGDVDLEGFYDPGLPAGKQRYGITDLADYGRIIDANKHGSWHGALPVDPMWDLTSDIEWNSAEVTFADEIPVWVANFGELWGPGYP